MATAAEREMVQRAVEWSLNAAHNVDSMTVAGIVADMTPEQARQRGREVTEITQFFLAMQSFLSARGFEG